MTSRAFCRSPGDDLEHTAEPCAAAVDPLGGRDRGRRSGRNSLPAYGVLPDRPALPESGGSGSAMAALQGAANLEVEAGRAFHPGERCFVNFGLPFGPKPRLILVYLNAEALRTGSPVIEVEDSLTAFVCRIGLSRDGRTFASSKTNYPASPPPRSGLPWPMARRRLGRSMRTSSGSSISGFRRTSGSAFYGLPPSL